MTRKENIIDTIIDGTTTTIALGLTANYPEYTVAIEAIRGMTSVISWAKIRCLFTELFSRTDEMRKDNVPMDYLSSPQFIQEVEQLLYEKSLEDLEQKRLLYANYFESCCRCSNIEKIKSQKYFNLLRELDLLEFSILKELPSHPSIKGHIKNILQKCIPHFNSLTIEDVNMQLESLTSKGLVKQISSQEMEAHLKIYGNIRTRKEQPLYYKSILGEKLLRFVDKS